MLKEKIRESEEYLSQRRCKWRNVVFKNTGGVMYGIRLYDDEQKAKSDLERMIEGMFAGTNSGINNAPGIPPIITKYNYGWHMQLPILNE